MAVPGTLKLLVVGAENLDRLVTVGQQQPYYILECGQQRSRSKPCLDDGTHPLWGTAHKFSLQDELNVLVIIKDEVTKGIIGQGIIDLRRTRQYGRDDGTIVLMNLGGGTAGTLRFKAKFTPSAGAGHAAPAPPAAFAGAAAPPHRRVSDSGSQESGSARGGSLRGVGSGVGSAADADDPMLASVTNKVSLAKQAMQQLTAELAELTGADGSGGGAAADGRPQGGLRSQMASPASAGQAAAPRGGAPGSLRVSMNSVPSAFSPVAGSASPGGAGPPVAGWQGAAPRGGRLSSADGQDVDELLELYGARAGEGAPPPMASPHGQLVHQLQAALRLAHREKLAAEEEANNVKQAMAALSKQHYLDVKRLREAPGGAGGAPYSPGRTPSPTPGILQMVDTHPARPGRRPRVSGDSSVDGLGGGGRRPRASADGSTDLQQLLEGRPPASPSGERRGAAGDEGPASPLPAYRLQIQVHQLERQLAEQAAKTKDEAAKREALADQITALQAQLQEAVGGRRQAEANTRAAEAKAAEQATQAAAARAEMAAFRAHSENSSSKEAQVAGELARVRTELDAALADRAELEAALGLMEKNSTAQVAVLQAELGRAKQEAAALRQGNSDVAALQAQLEAAREEASGLRNNSEEVEYLQAQLRRTLRQVVELQHQVQVLQSTRPDTGDRDDAPEPGMDTAMVNEHELLMQELVATKLELAELKEQQLVTQRQLFKAQQDLKVAGV